MPDSLRRPAARLAIALAAVAALGACTEKLDTRAACPSLCPNQDVTLRDTTIQAVTLDTTLSNFPARGSENLLLVSSRGAALDTRAVIRFDSLVRKFDRSTTETGVAITSLTTARLRLSADTGLSVLTAPFTVNVYDVDTPAIDPDDATLIPLFTGARLLGSRTFAAEVDVKDSLVVPLDPAKVAAKLSGGQRIRVGVTVASSAGAELRVYATTGATAGLDPVLAYDPTDSTDAIKPITTGAFSAATAASPTIAFNVRDYTLVASAQPPVARDELAVGGLPGRRVYMRFAIPSALLDSTTIVRASLVLTQRVSPGVNPDTALSLVPLLGLAGRDVTDPSRAALVTAGPEVLSLGLSSVSLKPGEAGNRLVELATIVRLWRADVYDENPRALVLRIGGEGYVPGELRFYSTEAADPNVRPRLQLTYVPRISFGVP